jgi:hypothetical protein
MTFPNKNSLLLIRELKVQKVERARWGRSKGRILSNINTKNSLSLVKRSSYKPARPITFFSILRNSQWEGETVTTYSTIGDAL